MSSNCFDDYDYNSMIGSVIYAAKGCTCSTNFKLEFGRENVDGVLPLTPDKRLTQLRGYAL
ncbi:hypothetical protein CXF82_21025 [Shewanella sp. GutDb-MelDb]|nr:hypothetical protein CXF82_21025 [Shewanella sp. GutDb-MelDb]